jgi:NitT/TauT family transport system substrate-binding protein
MKTYPNGTNFPPTIGAKARMSRRALLQVGLGGGAIALSNAFPRLVLGADARFKIPVAQTVNSLFYLSLYAAMDEGLLKNEGVEVDLISAGSSPEAVNALVAGQAACSTQDPLRCEAARQKGAPIKLIGASINRFAAYVVGKKGIAAQNVQSWKGRTIAATQRPSTVMSGLDWVLLNAGWKQDRPNVWIAPDGGAPLQMREVKMGNEFQALLAGAVDMAAGTEPGASDALARTNENHLIWSFPESFGEFLFGGWCAQESDIKNKPEMLQAFVNGIANSYKFIREQPQKAIASGKKWFPNLDPAAVESAFKRFVQDNVYPPRVTISEKAFQGNFGQFVPFTKYPLNPVSMQEATYLDFARKADSKFGL